MPYASAWARLRTSAMVLGLVSLVATSAVVTKELSVRWGSGPALVAIAGDAGPVSANEGRSDASDDPATPSRSLPLLGEQGEIAPADPLVTDAELERLAAMLESEPASAIESGDQRGIVEPAPEAQASVSIPDGAITDTTVRFFNGRPIRPVRTISMLVTAYSPDWRSCGDSADGITASLHHVSTNAHRLVAADPRLLPMGSMVSVPGYEDGRIVPVLDIGGKIKGRRLDVLYETHQRARTWGVQRLTVTVWDYADGQGKENWRAIRDARN